MADKDEVEPTEGSSAPDPSSPDERADAPQDSESTTAARTRSATSPRPRSRVTSHRRPKPNWPRTTSRSTRTPIDRTGSTDAIDADDAEFDEIVRNSGVADTDPDADGDDDDGKVLEPAGGRGSDREQGGPERRPARAPKGTADRQARPGAKRERTTPAKFVRQSVGELRKVVYPTGQQLHQLLRRRAGVRAFRDRLRERARPGLRRGDLQDLR